MARLRGEEKRAWERTLRLYDKLRSGGSPNVIEGDEIELGPDEAWYAETGLLLLTPTPVERTVTYQEIQRPFTLNPFQRARDAHDRAVNRAEFERLSREVAEGPEFLWIERGPVLVRLTSDRLICESDEGRWGYHRVDLTHLEFDVDEWSVELRYDGAGPIQLAGWGAIAIGLILIWLRNGPDDVAAIGLENMR
ncbi:hypothetical protein GCM10009557_33780 [Virgisporangium ochraceum]|uniref:Uncharacterized protein n=1 Tax=Virgisporangium ochraceum TaxID=65505 RepID=A0A8J3ZWF2_9ACTN|nr:hypothetical protein [Virgisporangium ochraceum]GIJ69675.1 hypothetical protein Voc01_045920 [Virgisporangium ochraceum]